MAPKFIRSFERRLSKHFPVRPLLYGRRFHAYCIGSAKSGTHSLSGIFERRYHAAHEPEFAHVIELIMGLRQGNKNDSEIRETLLRRDRRLYLEIESSQLCFFLLDEFLESFPDAKFILTIRDCYSWLDSILNNHLSRGIPKPWDQIITLRHGSPDFRHSPHARVLEENGFFPLEGYLSYWERHNLTVLKKVPPDRLLVLRTDRIGSELDRVAGFLRIPASSLDDGRAHLFRAPAKYGFLQQIDRDFLEDTVDRFGRHLMLKYFPEIRNADDLIRSNPENR